MLKKFNFQYLLSYLGLFPFFFIIIDKYFFKQIKEEIVINFIIYYCIMIFVFIGSTNWNLEAKIKNHIIFYGFLPSLLSVIIITLNLYSFSYLVLILSLVCLMTAQLIIDYFLIYAYQENKIVFYRLRLPLTLIIMLSIALIIV